MLNDTLVIEFLDSSLLNKKFAEGDDEQAPAALPDASLDFLVELCTKLNVKKVFEFGSGRSTKAMLSNGCSVTSIEDSVYWMQKTVDSLTESEKVHHTPLVKPLTTRFLGLFPVFDWHIDSQIAQQLKNADLILVDSPYYTPFRESTLWSCLTLSNSAIIILDDTRIPTLSRFCNRIAHYNNGLRHKRVMVGHTFDIFYHPSGAKLQLNHSFIDSLKGWYRYAQGFKFHFKTNQPTTL